MFFDRLNLVRLAAVAAVGMSCLAVGACGNGGTPSASAASAASSTADPLASLTADGVKAQAATNLEDATSVTVQGTIGESGGADISVNLGLRPGDGCAGTVGLGSQGSVKIVVIGKTIYLNGNNTYWKELAGTQAPAVISLVHGRYVKTSASNKAMAAMPTLCDLSRKMAAPLENDDADVVKGEFVTVGAIKALQLQETSSGSYVDVTDASKPEIVQMATPTGTGDGADTLTFSVGAPVTLAAPPASQVVDGSLIGLGPS